MRKRCKRCKGNGYVVRKSSKMRISCPVCASPHRSHVWPDKGK